MSSLAGRGAMLGRLLPRLLRSGISNRTSLVACRSNLVKVASSGNNKWYSTSVQTVESSSSNNDDSGWDTSRGKVGSGVEELLDKKLFKLDMDVRRTGRVMLNELDEVISFVESVKVCTTNQALLILRCCGSVLVDLDKEECSRRLERAGKVLQQAGVVYDVSHHNAILKVHLENENNIAVSDFLSQMEEVGVLPNRVTFQHLVGIYCQTGNIGGATTVLEHMKAQDMAINEAVFLSLLRGHCFNNDSESVDATLQVMVNSGLLMGAEIFTVMAVGYGKAGNWAKVEEVLEQFQKEDVRLDDGDVFNIMIACCNGGLEEQALSLIPMLPKKAGYFQEMRNALPQIIRTGAVDLALDVFLEFPFRQEEDRGDKGRFMVQNVVRAGLSAEKTREVVEKMSERGYNAKQHLVMEAAAAGNTKFCNEYGALMKESSPETVGRTNSDNNDRQLFLFLRSTIQSHIKRGKLDEVFPVLNNIRRMGMKVPTAILSNDLIPAMLNLDNESPVATLHRFNNLYDNCHWTETANVLLQCLLNNEDSQHFLEATGFLLNVNMNYCIPERWSGSLARSYLVTEDLESLTSFLFFGSRNSNLGRSSGTYTIFNSLLNLPKVQERIRPDSKLEDLLSPVISSLVKNNIGLPQAVGSKLASEVEGDSFQALVDAAVKKWEARESFWTEEREKEFLQERKRQIAKQKKEACLPDNVPHKVFVGKYSSVPEGLSELEAFFNQASRQGVVNNQLSDKLILAYAANDEPDKAEKVLVYSEEKGNFNGTMMSFDAVVKSHLRAGNTGAALKFVESQLENNMKVFLNTFLEILASLAESDQDERVIDLLHSFNPEKFVSGRFGGEVLLEAYAKNGKADQLASLFQTMLNSKWIKNASDVRVLNPLLEVHLVAGNSQAAIQEFERISRQYKKLPKKMELTNKLIEEEDIEGMQKVLDLSIEVIGEEKSLYDLAYSFLEMDRRAQVKKLFETPGLRFNEDKMRFLCNRLVAQKKFQQLEDLVQFSKGIFGCDRDFLYKELVSAYSKDTEKVEECWILIQEEGHAPSDELKIAIANALKQGGKTVPFEIPVSQVVQTNKPETEHVKQNEKPNTGAKKGKSQEIRELKKPLPEIVHKEQKEFPEDVQILAALESQDFTTLIELIEGKGGSANCRTKVLDTLIKADAPEVTLKVVSSIVNSYDHPKNINTKLKGSVYDSLKQMIEVGDLKGFEELQSLWGLRQKQTFGLSMWHKTCLLRHNSEEYVKILREDAGGNDARKWILGTETLKNLSDSNPELIEKINSLVAENNTPASIIMSKVALAKEDFGRLEELLEGCGDQIEFLVEDVNSVQKFDMISSKLTGNIQALDKLTNKILLKLGKEGKNEEILNVIKKAMALSVSLENVNKLSLKKLSSLSEFEFKEEAEKALKSKA